MRFVGYASFGLGGRVLPQVRCPASVAGPFSSVLPGWLFVPFPSGCRGWVLGGGWLLGRMASVFAQHGGQAGLPAVPAGKVFIFHGFWAPLAVSKRAAPYLYVGRS